MRKTAMFAVSLSFLLLFGCVEIRLTQQFFPNGRSHVVQQINIAGLLDVLNTSDLAWNNQSGFAVWDDLANYSCDAAKRFDSSASCHRNGDWLMIDQDRVSDIDYIFNSYSEFPYTQYEVTILRPPPIPAAIVASNPFLPNLSGTFVGNGSVETVAAMKAAGMRYRYRVIMPGDIYNISAGQIVQGGMEFDAMDQALARKSVAVKSRSYDWGQIAVAVILALDAILFIDVAAMWLINWAKRHGESLERLKGEADERAAEARAAARRTKLKGYDVYSFEGGDPISKLEANAKDAKKGGKK